MTHQKKLVASGCATVLALASMVSAQSASLVADIETATTPNSSGYFSSTPRLGALTCGDYLYLFATDGVHGAELWRTDGTPGGTSLSIDICPGPGPGFGSGTEQNAAAEIPLFRGPSDSIMFLGFDGNTVGLSIVRGDGTLERIYPSSTSDAPISVQPSDPPVVSVLVGNVIYFTARSNSSICLWASDGTATGTRRVSPPTSSPVTFGEMGVVNNKLVFSYSANNGVNREIWILDSVTGGMSLLKDIYPGTSSSSPHSFVKFRNNIYFFASNQTASNVLYVTDGTSIGTVPVSPSTNGSLNGEQPVATSDAIYFIGSAGTLQRYDGTARTTVSTTILPRPDTSTRILSQLDNYLYFCSGSGLYRRETDGSLSTLLTADSGPGSLFPVPGFGQRPARMYFRSYGSSSTGLEPYVSDGTAAGTRLLKDIFPGIGDSVPQWIGYYDGLVFFRAADNSNNLGTGVELYMSDGTTVGTTSVDINTPRANSNPKNLFEFGHDLYFDASQLAFGTERFHLIQGANPIRCAETVASSGSFSRDMNTVSNDRVYSRHFQTPNSICVAPDAQTVGQPLAAALGPSTYAGVPFDDGSLFYFALQHPTRSADNGEYRTVPWRSDGTPQGTFPLSDPGPMAAGDVYGWIRYQNETYFLSRQYDDSNYNLFATSGTRESTRQVAFAGAGSLVPRVPMFVLNGRLLYTAFSQGLGNQLWAYDGTGTTIRRINSPTTSGYHAYSWYPVLYNDHLVWVTDLDISLHQELWITDGTDAHTSKVADINSVAGSSPRDLTVGPSVSGSRIYFSADDGMHGRELWITDATAGGTRMVKDIRAGSTSSMPQSIRVVGDKVYFQASDDVHGLEWWLTDGTDAGTRLVADICPGSCSSSAQNSFVSGGNLYFSAEDGVHGRELWVILPFCSADFNADGAVDFFDYLDFVAAFASGETAADINNDAVVDFFDYLDFVQLFSTGC